MERKMAQQDLQVKKKKMISEALEQSSGLKSHLKKIYNNKGKHSHFKSQC